MAALDPLDQLQSELSCPLCLGYFTDPVIIHCGHNFCRACIARRWEGLDSNFPCPQCQAMSERVMVLPNRPLGNVADLSKGMGFKRKEREEQLCSKHQEPMKLFCLESQEPMCLECDRSSERPRQSFAVVPFQEAVQDCKDKLKDWVASLKKEQENVKQYKRKEEEKSSAIDGNLKSHRDNIFSAFDDLQEFIEAVKQNSLCSLERKWERNQGMISGTITELDQQHCSLANLITELEKCQQQDVDLLEDVMGVLNRCENVTSPTPEHDAAETTQNLLDLITDAANLQEKIQKVKGMFPTEVVRTCFKNVKRAVTLDPDTVNQRLTLSEDQRCVSCEGTPPSLLDHPKRFADADRCVLGSEGFTTGKHYWEVQLCRQGRGWYIGVATESDRKRGVLYSPEGGIWAVSQYNGQFGALTSPFSRLSLRECPSKVGVFLHYERGLLKLVNADTMEDLYMFTNLSFTQRIFPFFCLYSGAELRLV